MHVSNSKHFISEPLYIQLHFSIFLTGDHCYAGAEDLEDSFGITHDHSYLSPDVRIYTAEVIQDETPQLDSIPQTPLDSKDRDGLDLGMSIVYIFQVCPHVAQQKVKISSELVYISSSNRENKIQYSSTFMLPNKFCS